jgi:hypothetical protein
VNHFYEGIPGFFDFQDLYREQVERVSEPARFVEVGAFMGKSSAFMAVEIVNSGKNISFDVVDCWDVVPWRATEWKIPIGPQGVMGEFMRHHLEGGTLKHIRPIRAYSLEAARMHEDKSLDFVFIDDDHRFEAVESGIRAWLPKIKKGGVLAGHNINGSKGVKDGVGVVFGTEWKRVSKDCWMYRVGR